jgi:nucleoside-diphosphate-sugar epimerase
MLEAARLNGITDFLYSSSACVYAGYKQQSPEITALKEEDAYPADPEPGYGWEKLFTEELCRYYQRDYRFNTRIVRFHNVFGPLGTYEKLPWRLMVTNLKFGVMDSRHGHSCMLTTAWRDSFA